MKGYARFELRIDKIDPPAGDGMTHEVRVDGPTGIGSERIALRVAEEPWRSRIAQARSEMPDLGQRRAIGEALFKAVLGGDQVGKRWATSVQKVKDAPDLHGLRLALAITDPALAMLPWELLYDPDQEFVATAADRALSRFLAVEEPGDIPASERLSILLVVQSPKGLPEITVSELDRLQTSIEALGESVRLEILNNRPRDAIRNALQRTDFHVLHFLGHGKAGGLALTGPDGQVDPIDDQTFAQLFQGRHSLRLVVLSACHSAQANAEALFGGMGPALVRKHIPAVVAMQYPTVLIETAAIFSGSFYRALASGRPVDVAVNEARNAISSDAQRLATRDWSTPVLYLGTRDGRVLDLGEVAAKRQERGLKSLRELASRSQDVHAAMANLRGQVLDAKNQVSRLAEWLELEKELTSLAKSCDAFLAVAKKWLAREARRAGADGGDPHELLEFLEMPWEACHQQLFQLRTALEHFGYISGIRGATDRGGTALDIRAWSDELGALGEQIQGGFENGTTATLDGDGRRLRDRVGEQLTETRNALRRELKGLSEHTASLATRLE